MKSTNILRKLVREYKSTDNTMLCTPVAVRAHSLRFNRKASSIRLYASTEL